MNQRILFVSDDPGNSKDTIDRLMASGYEMIITVNALDGLAKAYQARPDLIILEATLPNWDEGQTCRYFRETAQVPIMMLTRQRSPARLVNLLKMGADVCLTRPVPLREFDARVRALLRRAASQGSSGQSDRIYRYRDLIIDFDKRQVTLHGRQIQFSPTEYKLLACLIHHPGCVLTRQFLLTQVWGPKASGETHCLRKYIQRLRQKIEPDPSNPDFIHNKRGVGYRFG